MGFDCAASLMAYTPAGTLSQLPELLPLDYLFKRRAVGFLRGSWLDANTSWLGFKACNSTADHGDLDAGTWVLEMGGQRWAIDLGSGNYGLKGYWDKGSKDGQRYSYYRKSTRGHNTLTFNGFDGHPGPSNQGVGAAYNTVISKFDATKKSATVDMSPAYQAFAQRVVRSFAWDSRAMRTLTVTDEIRAPKQPAVQNLTWAMHTRASVTVEDGGRSAVLRQGGVALLATVLTPPGATFSVAELSGVNAPQKSNVGVRKLLVVLQDASAVPKIAVTLALVEN